LANDVIKLNCTTLETYRKSWNTSLQRKEHILPYLSAQRGTSIQNCYQIPPLLRWYIELRQELVELGHIARNIVNARNRFTRHPLNLFFVNLEPAANNKNIFKVTALQNKIIQVEPPRTN
jgi:hypothetical protein